MRGVRINILDFVMQSDSIHRGSGQILPTAKRNFFACVLTAEPRLLEPIFAAQISSPEDALSGVYNCVNQRRGMVYEEE